MSDEAKTGSAGTPDNGGHSQGGGEVSSPFQARAQFLKNWDWNAIVSVNRGACARGKAQHGISSEAGEACAAEWEGLHLESFPLETAIDHLRSFHRRAPFLCFNGNTFATLGRELTLALLVDLPPVRKREASSAVAHYIAGVLDRESMVEIVESLCETAAFQPGDRVITLRGSIHGRIIRLLKDGRAVWKSEGSRSELIALPESLIRFKERKRKP